MSLCFPDVNIVTREENNNLEDFDTEDEDIEPPGLPVLTVRQAAIDSNARLEGGFRKVRNIKNTR